MTTRITPTTQLILAVIPLLLVGLVTQAWRNGTTMATVQAEMEHVQAEVDRLRAACP